MTKQMVKMIMNSVEQVTTRSNRRPTDLINYVMKCELGEFYITCSHDSKGFRPYKLSGKDAEGNEVFARKSDADLTKWNIITKRFEELRR